uniref:Uncharacterized protein n=1 Tax=Arion vulgaris TaxID=1028688 RepID=A0A0B7A703_9EUPU
MYGKSISLQPAHRFIYFHDFHIETVELFYACETWTLSRRAEKYLMAVEK